MAKYLFHGAYTLDGIRGVMKEGGTSRRDAVSRLIGGLGGTRRRWLWRSPIIKHLALHERHAADRRALQPRGPRQERATWGSSLKLSRWGVTPLS